MQREGRVKGRAVVVEGRAPLFMGVERQKQTEKTECDTPENSIIASYYHIWEASRGKSLQTLSSRCSAHAKGRCRSVHGMIDGTPEDMNKLDRYTVSVRVVERERRMLTESVDLRKQQIGRCSLWPTLQGKRTHAQIWLPSLISHSSKQTPLFDSWHGCHRLDVEKARGRETLRSLKNKTTFSRLCGMF